MDEWSARRRGLYLTTHKTLTTEKPPCPGGIRTHDLSRRAAADARPLGLTFNDVIGTNIVDMNQVDLLQNAFHAWKTDVQNDVQDYVQNDVQNDVQDDVQNDVQNDVQDDV